MEKKITVHVVKVGDKTAPFASAARAAEAVKLLALFGVEAEVEKEKRVVTL